MIQRPKIFPLLPCKRLHFATHLTFAGFNNVLNPTKDLHLIIYSANHNTILSTQQKKLSAQNNSLRYKSERWRSTGMPRFLSSLSLLMSIQFRRISMAVRVA